MNPTITKYSGKSFKLCDIVTVIRQEFGVVTKEANDILRTLIKQNKIAVNKSNPMAWVYTVV